MSWYCWIAPLLPSQHHTEVTHHPHTASFLITLPSTLIIIRDQAQNYTELQLQNDSITQQDNFNSNIFQKKYLVAHTEFSVIHHHLMTGSVEDSCVCVYDVDLHDDIAMSSQCPLVSPQCPPIVPPVQCLDSIRRGS